MRSDLCGMTSIRLPFAIKACVSTAATNSAIYRQRSNSRCVIRKSRMSLLRICRRASLRGRQRLRQKQRPALPARGEQKRSRKQQAAHLKNGGGKHRERRASVSAQIIKQYSMEAKTEQPTPKKRQDARKEGQIARSSEIVDGAQL